MSDDVIRLNLGAGGVPLPGFTPVDRRNGQEAYPLEYEDNSVEEIYASHILEHFPFADVPKVLEDWRRVLVPGGRIRIAVPNFGWMVEQLAEEFPPPIPVGQYIMGGQCDENDFHKSLFDRETLIEFMVNAGFERIGEWQSEVQDCASLEVSLNLQGFKPTSDISVPQGVIAILSCPRFGPTIHMQVAMGAFANLGIGFHVGQGAYWSHVLTSLMEDCLNKTWCRYVLTCDYDTIFSASDVLEVYRLMEALPEWDAMMPIQQKRSNTEVLFGIEDSKGKAREGFWTADFDKHVSKCRRGHFGMTLFRADALRKMPTPWFFETPDPKGSWNEGRVDSDINFWYQFEKAGCNLGLANRVVVGHLQEVITWPGQDLKPIFQFVSDFNHDGIPKEARR